VGVASRMVRLSAIPHTRVASVALAATLVGMPLTAASSRVPGSLPIEQIELLAVIGLAAGWIGLDRLSSLRLAPWGMTVAAVVILVGGGIVLWRVTALLGLHLGPLRGAVLVVSVVFGGLIRGFNADRRSMASLVAVAGAVSWLSYDIVYLPDRPLRDLRLYLDAGTTALHGASPYISGPLVLSPGADLPFVYPPPTIPLFALFAAIPRPIAEAIWIGGSVAAAVAALWLVGVRGRWLLVLLAWPPLALGIVVGNVATITFFLFVAGFRFGACLILGGIFKPQSTIPALWLVRERRWRAIVVGIAVVALAALLALAFAGIDAWRAWLNALRFFQESFAIYPTIQGASLARRLGTAIALFISAGAIGLALIGRGRNGLARFGVASIVASPTLYLHGLSPLLPGALCLGPELLWFVLGLGPWGIVYPSAWLAIAIVFLALLVASGDDLRIPSDLSPARADVHPAGRMAQVWPRAARPDPVVARSATSASPAGGDATSTT
jgi:hypothetical protein